MMMEKPLLKNTLLKKIKNRNMNKLTKITNQTKTSDRDVFVDLTIGPNDGHTRSKEKSKQIAELAR
jgi:hypothetical protein